MTKQRTIVAGVISLGVALIFAVLFLLMSQKSGINVEAPAPPRKVTPVRLPPPPLSIIAVKASLPMQAVKTLAETALKDYLSKPIERKDGAIVSTIKLNPGILTMTSAADGTVSIRIPFQFSGRASVSKKILGQVIEKHEDIEGRATAALTLTPTLNADWRITAKTSSDILIQKAEIEILGITISLRQILTKLVKEMVLPKLEDLIVEYITSIDIKTRVAGLWTRLHEPITVNRDPPIALVIKPLEVLARKLSSDGQTLSLSFGIKTYIQANIGDVSTSPVIPAEKRADLPDIHFVEALESGYHIIAPIDVTYPAIENFAMPHVKKAHNLKGISTLVNNLTLYGSGVQLVAGVGFSIPSLGADGQIYLLGTPVYDTATMSVSVTGFDYALTTQNLLLDITETVGEGIFPNLRTTVEEKLTFPLEEQLTTLHEKLSDVIAERSIGSHVLLRGTVETITPEALYLTQTGVRIPFRLEGDLACEINLNPSQVSY